MSSLSLLQHGEYVGIRELRGALTKYVHNRKKTFFVTEHGKPKKVLVPYELFLELLEVIEDLKDKVLLQMAAESRKAQNQGKSVRLGNLRRELKI